MKEFNGLKEYLEKFMNEDIKMSLSVNNREGGGSVSPDESKYYESRLEWLQEDKRARDPQDIWRLLAEGEVAGVKPGTDEELVFIQIPTWFVMDNDELKSLFELVKSSCVGQFAMLQPEMSEGTDGYAISRVYDDTWKSAKGEYGVVWVPKSLATVLRPEGNVCPIDTAHIKNRDALEEGVSPQEAEPEDYNWRKAISEAYDHEKGNFKDPVELAFENAQDLPDPLYQKLEQGVETYREKMLAENIDITEDQIAIVVESMTEALTPSSQNNQEA